MTKINLDDYIEDQPAGVQKIKKVHKKLLDEFDEKLLTTTKKKPRLKKKNGK